MSEDCGVRPLCHSGNTFGRDLSSENYYENLDKMDNYNADDVSTPPMLNNISHDNAAQTTGAVQTTGTTSTAGMKVENEQCGPRSLCWNGNPTAKELRDMPKNSEEYNPNEVSEPGMLASLVSSESNTTSEPPLFKFAQQR